jgi:hypothetical protein
MTDPFPERQRYRLILPKRRLVKIEPGVSGCRLHVHQHGITEIIDCPVSTEFLDVQIGDMLTFYTELLAKKTRDTMLDAVFQ